MTRPINLNVRKWLDLCDLADRLCARPDQDAKALMIAAGRLTLIQIAEADSAYGIALTNGFRWDCSAFFNADGLARSVLAPGVLAKSALVRRLLTPEDERGAVALPIPAQMVEVESLPLWTARRDIGGV